tara:strand:+ start:842 stop:1597 length:756 start_codon:yes stop_codon:yes gene_type:complete
MNESTFLGDGTFLTDQLRSESEEHVSFWKQIKLHYVLIVGFEILRESEYLPPSVERNTRRGILSTSTQVLNWFREGNLRKIDPVADLDKVSVHKAFQCRDWVIEGEYIGKPYTTIFRSYKDEIKYSDVPYIVGAIPKWKYIVEEIEEYCRDSIWIGVIGQPQNFFGKVIKIYDHDQISTFLEWRLRDKEGNLIAFIDRRSEFDRLEVSLGDCLMLNGTPQEHFLSVEDGHTRCTRLSPNTVRLIKNYGKPK